MGGLDLHILSEIEASRKGSIRSTGALIQHDIDSPGDILSFTSIAVDL
jgi:hypothetical protein